MADITGSLSGGGPWGMLAGAGLQVFGNMFNKNEEKRRREREVEQALQQNQATRERINAMSPEANFRQKQMMLRDGRSNAMQAAGNVAGGSVANSGMGGDYGSGKIAAMKASPMMAQATSQYDMQMANAVDQRQAQEDQKTGMLEQNTSQRAQISQMTDYINSYVLPLYDTENWVPNTKWAKYPYIIKSGNRPDATESEGDFYRLIWIG